MIRQTANFPNYFTPQEIEWCNKNNAYVSDESIIFENGTAVGGYYEIKEIPAQTLDEAKAAKQAENERKAYTKIESGKIYYSVQGEECLFFPNKETQNDLVASAVGFVSGTITEKTWTTSDAKQVTLTPDDVGTLLLLVREFLDPLWEKWGNYKRQIEEAETFELLSEIVIDYN